MTPPAETDDALRRALAEIERLRADNAQLVGLPSATQRFDREGVWEQAQLQLALALSGIGLWRHDLRTGLLHHDERAQAMVGRIEGALGVPLDAVRATIHPDDLADVQAAFSTTLASGGPVDTQTRYRHADGRWRCLLTRRLLMRDAQGQPAMILGVALDVTEQQQRTHEATERLRVANERTSLALSAVHMGTWSHDVASGGDDWDEQMFLLRGLTPGSPVPNREQRMALVLPEDRPVADTQAMPFTTSANPLAYEFRVRRANDGAVRTLASRSIALTDAQGRVTRRIGINWDVTEVRQAERLQRERELALRNSRNKSALFGRISHELRTPLNAVLGFAQLMQSENEQSTTAAREHRLQQIQSAGKRLLALVDNVLDLGDSAESTHGPARVTQSLTDALDSATAALAQAALSRHVRIERGELSPRIVADEQRLQQLLAQLLGNAIKFSRPHGVVRLHARLAGRDAVLSIEDSGPGIDAERARRLFEPFAGPDGSASAAAHGIGLGIGIGLAIGQSLAQRMGGRIELARTGPQGSVFELWLPQADASPAAAAPTGRAPALLYIEDNDVNMLIVRELLAKRPRVAFHGAADGASGVRLARELLPSLVLIDMQLPDFNGVEVLRQLRADPRTATLRCVALSANAMPEDMQSARAAGFDDYWTKPIDMATFLDVIDRLLPTI
jgi:PAS domain S-box-containing protein